MNEWTKCPKCGSENLEYDCLEIDASEVWQPAKCLSCGFRWLEVYTFSHNESSDGEKLDFKGDVIKNDIITLTPVNTTSGSPIDN